MNRPQTSVLLACAPVRVLVACLAVVAALGGCAVALAVDAAAMPRLADAAARAKVLEDAATAKAQPEAFTIVDDLDGRRQLVGIDPDEHSRHELRLPAVVGWLTPGGHCY